MKILIVGGAGYLGGALTDSLAESGHDILVYDLLLYEESYRKPVPFVYGDIRDHGKLKKYLAWADVVVWLAALVGDPACALNEELTKEINTNSVRYLIDNFKGRIIYLSTCSVYGAREGVLYERAPTNPLSLYAKTKLWSEQILSNSNALIFRLGTLYGISDTYSRIRFDLVVNTLVMRAAIHGKVNIFGGRQYRPLLHVRDAAAAISASLSRQNKGIYNLHSENTTIIEIAERIKEYFSDLRIECDEAMFQDSRNYRVTSEKAEKELGFSPGLSIDDSIVEFKKIMEDGRIKNSFITRFSNYLYLKPLISEYESPLGKSIKFNI
jgi:nucleoside-diphosphate-sugar epimerase